MQEWLPPPEPGTRICIGFDGSENNDWSGIRAETVDGYQFTPRYGPDDRPTIWNPVDWEGRIPRHEVAAGFESIFSTYKVKRAYCDPHGWYTEIGQLALEHGGDVVFEWPTNKPARMYDALKRFQTDLVNGRIRHDGCPFTQTHMDNAVKRAAPGDRYTIGKPAEHQKIDLSMSSVLAHEAAADARTDGWENETEQDSRMWCF